MVFDGESMKKFQLTAKLICVVIISILLQQKTLAQEGWNLIHTFDDGGGAVFFKDSLNGFAPVAPSGIYKTTDGGITWDILNIPDLNNNIVKIIAVGDEHLMGVGLGGTIIKSVDAGKTWEVKNVGSADDLASICFTTNGKLFTWSTQRNIYKSVDDGLNWSVYSLDTLHFSLTGISFSDENIGFGVGYYETSIKTTDRGETWFSIPPIIPGRSMFAIKFVSDSIGYVIGGEQIAKTSDGGNNWVIKYNSGTSQLNDITTWGKNIAWVVGSDKIVKTIDSGENWSEQIFSPYNYLAYVECVDSLVCFASSGSVLYKTTNGGVITSVDDNKVPNLFTLYQNYPNPFNPTTNIKFRIAKLGFVSLKVYDVLGRKVATLVNEEKPAGSYEVKFDGSDLSSGIYFYKLSVSALPSQDGHYTSVKKMILLK